MSNSLIKDITTRYVGGYAGTPPTPATPGRTYVTTETVCGFISPFDGFAAGDLSGSSTPSSSIYACAPRKVTHVIPGFPASPGTPSVAPTTVVDYHLGWNAGARSILFFTEDGYAEFKVRQGVVGVICGVNLADAKDAKYLGTNIDYAFYFAHGICRIQENGITVVGIGAYTDATVFRIERSGTSILYKVNGSTMWTSGVAVTATAPLHLEASMYSGGDEVFDPVIVQTSALDTSTQSGDIDASLPPLIDGIYGGGYSAGISASLEPLIAELLTGIPEPSYALIGGVLPALAEYGTSLTGELGQIAVSLPALDMLAADHPYGEVVTSLPPLFASLLALEGNQNASMEGRADGVDTLDAQNNLVVDFNSSGTITDVWTFAGALDAVMNSSATASVVFSLNQIASAIMNSSVIGGWVYDGSGTPGTGNPPISDGTETWAVNLQTTGSTQYENYGFNSYAMFNGRYYGAKASGLYLLEGDTDAGALIRARIAFGKLDFGTTEKVTVQQCYVGMSGAGNLFLKVIANGVAYIYSTRSFSDVLQQQRVTTGKGLRTNYVELELYNENGTDFEIDTVKFITADLSRKI